MDFVFIGFLVSLALSQTAAQIFAGLLFLLAIREWPNRRGAWEVKFATRLVLLYIVPLSAIDGYHNGVAGVYEGLHHTWTITAAFSMAVLAPNAQFRKRIRWWIGPFLFAAAFYLVQYSLHDYTGVWRYGFHRSPYIFAILLIAPSIFLLTATPPRRIDLVTWLIFLTTMLALHSRGGFVVWTVATIVVLSNFSMKYLLRRRAIWATVAIVLLFGAFLYPRPWSWNVFDLDQQSSVRHRLVIWSSAIDEIMERPVFGHGFKKFHPDPMAVTEEYREYLRIETNTHSGYLMVLHASGLTGFVVLWYVYGTVLYVLYRRRGTDGSDRLAITAFANLIAIAVASFGDKTFFTTLPMLEAWALVGLALGESEVGARHASPVQVSAGT